MGPQPPPRSTPAARTRRPDAVASASPACAVQTETSHSPGGRPHRCSRRQCAGSPAEAPSPRPRRPALRECPLACGDGQGPPAELMRKSHLPHLLQRPAPTPALPVHPQQVRSPLTSRRVGGTFWGRALSGGAGPQLIACRGDGTAALPWGGDSQAHGGLCVARGGRLGCVDCCQSRFSVRRARGWPAAGCLAHPIPRGSWEQGRPREAVSAEATRCWTRHAAVPARAAAESGETRCVGGSPGS